MNDVRKVWRFAVWLLLLWLAVLGTWGTGQSQQTPKLPEASSSSQDEAASVVSDQPITKAEAKALFRSVDEILQIVSQDTGLPIKHKVKRRLITRDQVERYVAKRLESDKDAQRLEREQLVLKNFRRITSNHDLHAAFINLLHKAALA